MKVRIKFLSLAAVILLLPFFVSAQRFMENLDRGVIAFRKSTEEVFISWRLLGTDPEEIGFNIYRGTTRINASPIVNSTNFIDSTSLNKPYNIKSVLNGIE